MRPLKERTKVIGLIEYEDDTDCLSDTHIMWLALDRKINPPKNRHFTDGKTMARLNRHLKKCEACREKFEKYCEEAGLLIEEAA